MRPHLLGALRVLNSLPAVPGKSSVAVCRRRGNGRGRAADAARANSSERQDRGCQIESSPSARWMAFSSQGGRLRRPDREGRASLLAALHTDPPVMQLDGLLRDRRPKSGARFAQLPPHGPPAIPAPQHGEDLGCGSPCQSQAITGGEGGDLGPATSPPYSGLTDTPVSPYSPQTACEAAGRRRRLG